jgi:hypothetical protein
MKGARRRHICWAQLLLIVPRRHRLQCRRHGMPTPAPHGLRGRWFDSVPDRWLTPEYARRELRRMAELAQRENATSP